MAPWRTPKVRQVPVIRCGGCRGGRCVQVYALGLSSAGCVLSGAQGHTAAWEIQRAPSEWHACTAHLPGSRHTDGCATSLTCYSVDGGSGGPQRRRRRGGALRSRHHCRAAGGGAVTSTVAAARQAVTSLVLNGLCDVCAGHRLADHVSSSSSSRGSHIA